MCGIFGIYRRAGLMPADRWALRGMADQLRSRGPDGEGFALESNVAVGMRRLAIIDLNGGWQPIESEDRSVALVANGEIYNYVELRAELESRGHRFSTASDCETIVHLYEEMGADCVHRLRGMFAIAIIDRSRRRLLLARDRMGEKPLALVQGDGFLGFCSEIAGLVAGGVVPLDLDPSAVVDYYHWNFIPEPRTAVRGVRKLDGGCRLTVDLDSGAVSEDRYWSLSDAPPVTGDPVELVRSELDEIARIITRSEVPIGVGLSGGIDSSGIAALALRTSSQSVTGFTIGYEGNAWQDERALAREFAHGIGLRHVEMQLRTRDVVADFGRMCALRDDPIVDISSSGFLALYRLAHEHGVRVILAGQGSDELFWGYEWFRRAVRSSHLKSRALRGDAGLGSYVSLRPPPVSIAGSVDWLEDGAGLLKAFRDWRRDRNAPAHQLVFWDERREYRVAVAKLRAIAGPAVLDCRWEPAACFTGESLWRDVDCSLTCLLCDTFLQSNGLIMCDRLSMACGVEGRLPFTDYRLAEVVVGLRRSLGDRGDSHKPWLTGALRGLVPDSVFRRKKRGFTPPWRSWITEITRAYGPELSGGELVRRGILSEGGVRAMRSSPSATLRPDPLTFASIILEQWCRGMTELERGGASLRARAERGEEPDLRGTRSDVRRLLSSR